ncbi:MAG: acyltransferase [Mucilaginibacter polytrichastri]|nr:acyltransferase [Mucilaginibacter polytrichastri]
MDPEQVQGDTALVTAPKKEAVKYPFIDFVRFISMMGIVWAHTEAFPQGIDAFHFLKENGHAEAYIFFKQFFKFSVFCFFLISGFLLGDKITHVLPLQYFRRRIDSTLRPYLISLGIFLVIFFSVHSANGEHFTLLQGAKQIAFLLIGTPFWFIPTYFVSLIVILLFVRFVDSIYFGLLLLIITGIYTFPNEYTHEFVHGHTTTFFGFIFYIWFGIYVRRKQLVERFKKINIGVLLALMGVFYVISSFESLWMFNHNNDLFFNILRLSNQFYGITVFIFLIRICGEHPTFGFFNPRKETYGVYLYHFYFVAFIFPFVYTWLHRHISAHFESTYTVMVLSVVHFLLCYICTTLFVKLLIRIKAPVL